MSFRTLRVLLLLAGVGASTLVRRSLLRGAAAVSAGCLLPGWRPALADRGKDLYISDRAILSGGGALAQEVNVPVFDENGALIEANGYTDEVSYRTISSGSASVEVLQNWVATDGGGWRDPGVLAPPFLYPSLPLSFSTLHLLGSVIGTTASVLGLSAAPTKLTSIADLGRYGSLVVQ